MSTTVGKNRSATSGGEQRTRRRRGPWLLELYRSSLGKKYVMALTGLVLMGYVLAHMVGNLKLYLGPESINRYGEWHGGGRPRRRLRRRAGHRHPHARPAGGHPRRRHRGRR